VRAELEPTWSEVRAQLRQAVGDSVFQLWLDPLQPAAIERDTLVLTAPEEIRNWVAGRYARVLQTCAAAVLGPSTTVSLIDPADPVPLARTRAQAPTPESDFNPKYTFDQFIIGDGNRLAHAAALAVAEQPGQTYNPLFIYGPPGLGKTHLLHAIGNYVRAHGGGLSVLYTTTESFTNGFLDAVRGSGSVEDFKRRYRHADVLLIDDVQFLESKAKTEEEFFHTFNALYDAGSQLVITSDRLPGDMGALAARLRERFESGLVTDVRAPDRPTRMTILRKRVRHDGIELPDPSILDLIAERVDSNIRALEGALIRVIAYHSLTGGALDRELTAKVLDDLYPRVPQTGVRTVPEIQEAVCRRLGIDPGELVSERRTAAVAWARQVAMYLARELTGASLPAIGSAFGGRNHATVLHACRRTAERIAEDPDVGLLVEQLTADLGGRADRVP
jgi:chromosomal replication initiator protein